jgi:hypothetical protein
MLAAHEILMSDDDLYKPDRPPAPVADSHSVSPTG